VMLSLETLMHSLKNTRLSQQISSILHLVTTKPSNLHQFNQNLIASLCQYV